MCVPAKVWYFLAYPIIEIDGRVPIDTIYFSVQQTLLFPTAQKKTFQIGITTSSTSLTSICITTVNPCIKTVRHHSYSIVSLKFRNAGLVNLNVIGIDFRKKISRELPIISLGH